MEVRFPELGYYGLPGHVLDPKPLIDEVKLGEKYGFGSIWLSERLNTKNVAVLSGLAAAHAPTMGIASGLISNLPLRHPLVTAAYGSTMALLTDNRFALGMGRGQPPLSKAAGVAPSTFKLLEDYIAILRALWRGESVTYSGPVGELNDVSLSLKLDQPPPVIMAVMGEKTCYWAGQHCDGVVYNSMWSPSAISRSTEIVRKGASDAGRDPDRIRVWSVSITACDRSEEEMLNFVVRRMNTYLPFKGMYEAICEANGWDFTVVEKARALKQEMDGRAKGTLGDESTSRNLDDIRRFLSIYPPNWINGGCIVGSPAVASSKMIERFDAGSDGVLLHGSGPGELTSLLEEWSVRRPAKRFEGRSSNPGL